MMGIEVAMYHPMNIDLMAQRWIRFGDFFFTQAKIDIFVNKVCSETLDFIIEPDQFFSSLYDLEVGIHSQLTSRCSPGMMLNVLVCVVKQVKVGEECIINNLVPLKGLVRRREGFGS